MNHKGSCFFILFLVFLAGACGDPVRSDRQAVHANDREKLDITVYRSPSCGCCSGWIEHLRRRQFQVNDVKTEDMNAIKRKYGVPPKMASCHTAIVGGYVIEGHVPAEDIREFLAKKPDVAGISVPQMPVGTPGMEMGDRKDPFSVISFSKSGEAKVFKHYETYQLQDWQ